MYNNYKINKMNHCNFAVVVLISVNLWRKSMPLQKGQEVELSLQKGHELIF